MRQNVRASVEKRLCKAYLITHHLEFNNNNEKWYSIKLFWTFFSFISVFWLCIGSILCQSYTCVHILLAGLKALYAMPRKGRAQYKENTTFTAARTAQRIVLKRLANEGANRYQLTHIYILPFVLCASGFLAIWRTS